MVAFNFRQDNAQPAYSLHMHFAPLHDGLGYCGVSLARHDIRRILLED